MTTILIHDIENLLANIKSTHLPMPDDLEAWLYQIKTIQAKILYMNQNIGINRCIICNVDLGEHNPRQYCCKTYCPLEKN